MDNNLTVAEETVLQHLEYCNNVQKGFYEVKEDFPFKVGDMIYCDGHPRAVIGLVFGFVYCPISKQNRAVIGVNADVSIERARKATKKEEMAFNLFTKDFKPVEARYTAFL